MDAFKKYWGFIAMIIGGLVGAYGWIYNQGAQTQNLNGRIFDSPEQKVHVVEKVESLPSAKDEWAKHLRDSMDTANRIKSRKIRDSLMILEYKARKKTDSINLLNADQMYQIKEEIKKLKNN